MSAIKDFFKRIQVKAKFKQAGPGIKLSETGAASPQRVRQDQSASQQPPSVATGGTGAAHFVQAGGAAGVGSTAPRIPTAEQRKAAEAAAVRASATPRGVPTRKTIDRDRLQADVQQEMLAEQRHQHQQQPSSCRPATAAATGCSSLSETVEQLPVDVNIRYTCELLPGEKLNKQDMQGRIEEYLTSQLSGEEPAMAAALIIRTLNKDVEAVKACVDIIVKYLDNVIANPGEEKYTKIRIANKVFQERVASQRGALEFLNCAGFVSQRLPLAGNPQLVGASGTARQATEGGNALAPSGEADPGCATEEYLVLPLGNAAPPVGHLTELKEILMSAEPIKPQLDPDVKLYRVPHPGTLGRFRELPAEFYRMTVEQIRREQQARTEALEKAGMLRTRAMRERDEQRELRRYRFALVRVRLPGDGDQVLQVVLNASDRLQALFDVVSSCLRYDWLPFRLTASSGGELTDTERTLAELQLAPASVVNLSLDSTVLVDAAQQLGVDALEPSEIVRPDLLEAARYLV